MIGPNERLYVQKDPKTGFWMVGVYYEPLRKWPFDTFKEALAFAIEEAGLR